MPAGVSKRLPFSLLICLRGVIPIRNLNDIRAGVIREDGLTYPGKSVIDYINEPAFESSKGEILDFILDIEKASLLMLRKQGILSESDAARLAEQLRVFPAEQLRAMKFDREYAEDMFFAVEKMLGDLAGGSASNLHLGRSRNDMMRTVNKMNIRARFFELCVRTEDFIEIILAMAEHYAGLLMPGYTHTQQAQPLTLGHYLLGVAEMLQRDLNRLRNEFSVIQLCPMGAGALTTTSFPIDRAVMCELLGFDQVMVNSYDAVCSSDFLTGAAAAVSVLCGDLGRFVMHLHVWSAMEYGILKPGRAYIGISSMMPQKRNPSTLEHVRAGLSECVGQAAAVTVMNHNCEFEGNIDVVDSPDVLCGLLEKAGANIDLLGRICATMDFDEDLLRRRTLGSFAVMTDFADFLVQKEHIEYRMAHAIASRAVDACLSTGRDLSGLDEAVINDAFFSVTGRRASFTYAEALSALDASVCAERHNARGGTSKKAVSDMLRDLSAAFEKDKSWLEQVRNRLDSCKALLEREINNL